MIHHFDHHYLHLHRLSLHQSTVITYLMWFKRIRCYDGHNWPGWHCYSLKCLQQLRLENWHGLICLELSYSQSYRTKLSPNPYIKTIGVKSWRFEISENLPLWRTLYQVVCLCTCQPDLATLRYTWKSLSQMEYGHPSRRKSRMLSSNQRIYASLSLIQ